MFLRGDGFWSPAREPQICRSSRIVLSKRMRQRAAILVILGLVVAACSHGVIVAPVTMPIRGMPPLLTWVGEFTRPAGSTYSTLSETTRFGSISGLARDTQTNQWVGVIDDRDTRIAWLSIDVADGRLTVSPTKMTILTAGPGVDEAVATRADLEAIAALPDGTFLVSEEGHLTSEAVFQPALLHITREGVVTDVISFPEPFQVRRDQSRGVRDNLGFEGLTRTPDGRLIAALEQPLIEDGPTTSFDRGAPGRLVEFTPRRGGGFRVGRQWSYPIERTPRVEGFPEICPDGENGVSEVLAITNALLLSMERACLQDPQTNQAMNAIQIFAIELSGSELRKTLVLDLSTLAERMLSKELSRLENFEGMAFGPTAINGTRTLLLVSDDNFRATQKTSFLLFGLRQITR
jgi:hypothetical protein